jgi:hypothetical protein
VARFVSCDLWNDKHALVSKAIAMFLQSNQDRLESWARIHTCIGGSSLLLAGMCGRPPLLYSACDA